MWRWFCYAVRSSCYVYLQGWYFGVIKVERSISKTEESILRIVRYAKVTILTSINETPTVPIIQISCTSFWELLLSYAFSIFHLSVLRNTCIIYLIVFLFLFLFFSEDRSNNRQGLSLHFTQKIFDFTCPSRMHCTCHIWSKWTPWRIIISFSGSGPFDPSLCYPELPRSFFFFFFLPHPPIKSFLEPISRFSTFSLQRMPVLFQFIVILG